MAAETSPSLAQINEAAKTLEENRTGIVLTGRVVNGKVELDQSCLDQIAKKFGDASKVFVAVNAPFDPKSAPTE